MSVSGSPPGPGRFQPIEHSGSPIHSVPATEEEDTRSSTTDSTITDISKENLSPEVGTPKTASPASAKLEGRVSRGKPIATMDEEGMNVR